MPCWGDGRLWSLCCWCSSCSAITATWCSVQSRSFSSSCTAATRVRCCHCLYQNPHLLLRQFIIVSNTSQRLLRHIRRLGIVAVAWTSGWCGCVQTRQSCLGPFDGPTRSQSIYRIVTVLTLSARQCSMQYLSSSVSLFRSSWTLVIVYGIGFHSFHTSKLSWCSKDPIFSLILVPHL
jgi:hypothetical protein